MSEPIKPAAQLEAEGVTTVDVEWRGHTFTADADAEGWTVETTLAFEEGKAASIIRELLGPVQWAEFMSTKPKNRDLKDLSSVLADALGLSSSGN